jgi:hypothetical protein
MLLVLTQKQNNGSLEFTMDSEGTQLSGSLLRHHSNQPLVELLYLYYFCNLLNISL